MDKQISKPLKKVKPQKELDEELVIREPVDIYMPVDSGRDPSTELVVTYQNEAAKKHPYNKESDAKTVFIQENGIVIYSF